MELITQIRNALKKAGLDEALAESIKVTDETQIAAEIEKLKAKADLTPDEVTKKLKEAGLEDIVKKLLQSETDKRVTQAIATHDQKLAKEKEDIETKRLADEAKTKGQAEMTATEKTIANMAEQIGDLNKKLDGFTESGVKTKRDTLIKTALKKADLSEGLSNYINVEKDDEIEEKVNNLKTELLGIKQAEIDEKIKNGEIPNAGGLLGSVNEKKAEEYAEERNNGSKDADFIGKSAEEMITGKPSKA